MDGAALGMTLGGLVLLVIGAQFLERAASQLTAALPGGSSTVRWLLVLSCAAIPRLAVSIQAAWAGQSELALGTVVGGNIFYLLFVIGLLALLVPLAVPQQLVRLDVPILIGSALLTFLLSLDGAVSRLDGVLLLAGLAAYVVFTLRRPRSEQATGPQFAVHTEAAQSRDLPEQIGLRGLGLAAGIGLVLVGASWFTRGSIAAAQAADVSPLLAGFTLVAIGAALPEISTWIMAILRGHRAEVPGRVVTSSVLAILAILGLTALVAPAGISVPPGILQFDIPVMLVVSIASVPIWLAGSQVSRQEGLLFAGYYVIYLLFLIWTAPQHGALPLLSMLLLMFAAAPAGLLVREDVRRLSGWVFALIPLTLFVLLSLQLPAVLAGETLSEAYPWVAALGLELAFTLNGLGLLFALIITGIGTLIVLYSSFYMAGTEGLGRFYLYLLVFMGSMLGVVLSANVLTLFVFWELTSASSYLLIGFKHEYADTRRGAQQGLLVTAGGGLALLFGLLLLAEAARTVGIDPALIYNIDAILAAGPAIKETGFYAPALILIFLGCFTKSAQFPFHFWLPNAMAAPTPASAFLHSATMVKAGVYLLARLNPGLGDTLLWSATLTAVGATTLLVGSTLALRQYDLKGLLAYSTISVLGVLTMVIGLGGDYAAEALVAYILAHALYKSALFLVAGAVDHEAGTRDLRRLGGLRRDMPVSMVLAIIGGLAMAGIPITFGFVAKELILKAAIESPLAGMWITLILSVLVVTAIFAIIYTWRFVGGTFFGSRGDGLPHHVHEAPVGMLIGPGVPAALTLLLSLALPAVSLFLSPAAGTVAGHAVELHLHLWEGFNLALMLTIGIIVIGFVFASTHRQIAAASSPLPAWLNADRIYDATISGLLNGTQMLTRKMQSGRLRTYLAATFVTFLALIWPVFLAARQIGVIWPPLDDLVLHEVIAALLIPVGVIATIRALSPVGAIIAAGMVGAMISLFFVLFSAPDLALTQLLIEVLLTVFLLLVFSVLPTRFELFTSTATRMRDAFIALAVGLLMVGLTLVAATNSLFRPISPYYLAESLPGGKGANVVNVILVDFRGLDTLGEITVLLIAALGITGLLRLRQRRKSSQAETDQAALSLTVDETDPLTYMDGNGDQYPFDQPRTEEETTR